MRAAGFSCDEYLHAQAVSWGHQLPSWEEEIHRVSQWVANHPKPLGLMACNDFRGVQALDACRAVNIAVPEEVAVIGVDNETLACELSAAVTLECHSRLPSDRLRGRQVA